MKIEIKEISFEDENIYISNKYDNPGVYKVNTPTGSHIMFVSKKTEVVYGLFIDDSMINAMENSMIKENKEEKEEKTISSISEDTLLKAISIIAHNTKPKDLER